MPLSTLGLHPSLLRGSRDPGFAREAFTLVAPEEEPELRTIERAVGRQLPRVIVPDFDYTAGPDAALEVPIADRIAAIRTRKAEGRARAGINADRLAAAAARTAASPTPRPPTGRRSA